MENRTDHWKLSVRDGERHSLDWCKNNPKKAQEEREKLKKEIIKLNEISKEKINLKEEYPALFDD